MLFQFLDFFFHDSFLFREQDALATTLFYLHHKAVAGNKMQQLVSDLEHNSYRYQYPHEQETECFFQRGVHFGFLPGTKGPPSNPTTAIQRAVTFDLLDNHQEHAIAYFYPHGATSSGTIYLLDKKKQKMVAITMSVGESAGIKKYLYADGVWQLLSA